MMTEKETRGKYYVLAFAALFLTVFVLSLAIGKFPISLDEILRVFAGKLRELIGSLFGVSGELPPTWSSEAESIMFRIRMPRVLAGAMIGAGLAAAGAAYQGLFRNPLVSPDILGASAGAGFGAALAIYLGLNYFLVSAGAFIFSISAVGTAYFISTRARRNTTLGMVLAGIMISSLFSSGTSFIKLIADPGNVLPSITFWLMGSISNVRTEQLVWAAVPVGAGLVVLLFARWKLNLLTMGDDEARSMGVSTKFMRIVIVVFATLITAASVAISGLIGWVGLVIPHFARLLVGYDYRVMMPVSMLMGASYMMLVDDLARSVATAEIPLGILTAFVGAPFFLYLLLGRGNRM